MLKVAESRTANEGLALRHGTDSGAKRVLTTIILSTLYATQSKDDKALYSAPTLSTASLTMIGKAMRMPLAPDIHFSDDTAVSAALRCAQDRWNIQPRVKTFN